MADMLPLAIDVDSVHVGDRFTVRFERTLRVPDDGRRYPLPPGLGRFELHRVEEYSDKVPEGWRDAGGVFISMYQAEALWLSFEPRRGSRALSRSPWAASMRCRVGLGRTC